MPAEISESVRQLVRDRAQNRCEFCRIHQSADLFRFQLDHAIPRQHGGSDDLSNLSLCCNHCNLNKGPNLSGIDPESGVIVPLFNPRMDTWNDHFRFIGLRVFGRTPTGRATVRLLKMNSPHRVNLRRFA